MIFGASSLYLVLKVGLTVSASIPVAVISITLSASSRSSGLRDATILENNIVQTAGSAGESIAFGLGVTMPAIMILGFDLEITRVMLVAILGGLLGILMMIPLRRALIVAAARTAQYPEGTACAEVLKAAASRESRDAAQIGVARRGRRSRQRRQDHLQRLRHRVHLPGGDECLQSLEGTSPEKIFGDTVRRRASISAEISRRCSASATSSGRASRRSCAGGGVLAYLVLIPAIKFFGASADRNLAPGTMPISRMRSEHDIRGATFSTSAPAPSPQAASSAFFVPCRPSGMD